MDPWDVDEADYYLRKKSYVVRLGGGGGRGNSHSIGVRDVLFLGYFSAGK